MLRSYDWPGNVRELRNTLEWVAFMHDDVELKPEHLINLRQTFESPSIKVSSEQVIAGQFVLPASGFNLEEHFDDIIQQALQACHGNKTAAALKLGISRRSLYCRLDNKKD